MKNIGRIFQRDIRRICKNALALSVAIGIVLLPALYAWINIAASWDPYGNTGNLKVAVASDDVGYTVVDIDLNIGDKIVDKLRSNDQIGWQFVDRETAIDGVKTGKYYAAIVIPSDFSEKMASFLSDDVKQPKIIYYLNEKTNAIAPKITDSGVSSVQRQINETFSEEATKVVVTALNRISDRLDTGDASLGDRIIDRLRDGQTALERVSLAIDVFLGATDTFGELTATTQAMLPDAQQTTDQLQQTTDQLGELLQITRASADRVADSADRILDAAVDGLDDAAKEVLSLLDDLDSVTNASSVNHLIDKMQRLADRLAKANATVGQIRTLIERLPLQPEHLIKALHALENKFESAESSLRLSVRALRQGQDVPAALYDSLRDVVDTVDDQAKIASDALSEIKPTLHDTIDEAFDTLNTVSGLTGSMSGMLPQLDDVLSHLDSAMGSAADALRSAKTLVDASRSDLSKLIDDLSTMEHSELIDHLTDMLQNDSSLLGSFMASPVQVENRIFFPIQNYGSAMTPFYSILACWVGGVVLVAIFKTEVDEDEALLPHLTHSQRYLGRLLLFLLMSVLQALIICVGDVYFLGVQCLNVPLFLLAGIVASVVFTLIIYTLTISFGDIGKAIAVIIMIIQVAGSGGTFPIELVPEFFRKVYRLLPFTHAMNAMREVIAGPYQNNYWMDLLKLCAHIPVALLLGLALRKPFIRMNRFLEERLKDTHLM